MAKTPPGISRQDFIRCVDWVIRERKTRKVLRGPFAAEEGEQPGAPGDFEPCLREAISSAGLAPFHYARHPDVPEPWRFFVLDRAALDALIPRLGELLVGKLPKILAGAGALVQVTWLPEDKETKQVLDWEHAAAAAAAVQNFVLAAEARGMGTYWSSAAQLASRQMFELCGIPQDQRYLGSVFVGRPLADDVEPIEGFSGKMRPLRTPSQLWCTWVEIPP